MNIFPAIDIIDGCAVRLFKGDYNQKTVYSEHPEEIAVKFKDSGAEFIHIVDLDAAKLGEPKNFKTIKRIIDAAPLFSEFGGGIRNIETIKKYVSIGVNRLILGTAAVTDEAFLSDAIKQFGDKIAVGIDIKDGFVAIRGWTESSSLNFTDFALKMQDKGVKTLICTDISKDGAMRGTNLELYKELSERLDINIVASGGISSIEDVRKLRKMNLYGAIIGKAYYTGAINLDEAIEVAK